MRSKILLVLCLCFTALSIQNAIAALTPTEMDRVKAFKKLLYEVDTKPISQTAHELERTGHPQTYINMREAMAKVYTDIVREQEVKGLSKKEWLYSMITLNMAYLQLVGTKTKAKASTPLDVLIRNKLRSYLPDDIDHRPGFRHSVD